MVYEFFFQSIPVIMIILYVIAVYYYFYSQFIDVSVLDGGWSERPEQMARAKRYRLLVHHSSSSSTNFIETQVLKKTSGPLCVTCYTSVNATVAGVVRCRMIYGTVPSSVHI